MEDTYLQTLLKKGNVNDCFVGVNRYEIPVPSNDLETPPTFITKYAIVLVSEDGVRYSITEEQLELEKDAMLAKYPDESTAILASYNFLKSKMEVS